jgi:hypothetical protein
MMKGYIKRKWLFIIIVLILILFNIWIWFIHDNKKKIILSGDFVNSEHTFHTILEI